MSGLWRKLETPRHHANNRVRLAVKNDRLAQDVGIAVIAAQPQGIADDCERLTGIFFLLRKNAAKYGMHPEGREDTCGETGSEDDFRSRTTGKLIIDADVAAHGG